MVGFAFCLWFSIFSKKFQDEHIFTLGKNLGRWNYWVTGKEKLKPNMITWTYSSFWLVEK